MKTNLVKLENLLEEFAGEVNGRCCELSACIGEIDGKLVYLSVMTKKEARNQHDYEGINELTRCLES